MEGSFVKKLKDTRARAIAKQQRKLDAALPGPPGLSIAEIAAATPSLLAALERAVADAIRADPRSDRIQVRLAMDDLMAVGDTKFAVPSKFLFGEDNAWWSAICTWSATHVPLSSTMRSDIRSLRTNVFRPCTTCGATRIRNLTRT